MRPLTQSELESFPSLDWTTAAPRLRPAVRTAVETVLTTREGASLSRAQALLLANSEGDDLLGLLIAANDLRAEWVGNLITYVVNRNINFTQETCTLLMEPASRTRASACIFRCSARVGPERASPR